MNRVMHCARCGGALKITCDEHGTEFVPQPRMVPNTIPARGERGARRSAVAVERRIPARPRAGTHRDQLMAARSTDAHAPSSVAAIAEATGRSSYLTGIDLASLAKEGRVIRVARGMYIRGVE
jgi:hypothetical protein